MSAPDFDPMPVAMICPKCRGMKYVTRTDAPLAANCDECPGNPPLHRLVNALRMPNHIIFAIVTEETIEERFFSFFEGMGVPRAGDEVILPFEETDPLRETREYKVSGGVLLVNQLTLDYVHGNYYVLCHFHPEYISLFPGENRPETP